MGERICVESECGRTHYGRGWCRTHYHQWYRHGGPAPRSQGDKSVAERFWEKVDADGDCWVWIGVINRKAPSDGYGVAWDGQKTVGAHRLAWRLLVGEPPLGLDLDHLCRNRSCVNPDHLQPVTHLVNVRRGAAGWNTAAKTHCPRGHPYQGENLIIYQGRRFCRACRRSRWKNTTKVG